MTRSKTVHVTSAQKQAAKGLVARSSKTGKYLSSSVSKIANAKSSPSKGKASGSSASNGSAL